MRTNKIKITMIQTSFSGSNNYYLYCSATDSLLEKYDIELLTPEQARYNRHLNHSDVYITTHGEHAATSNKINIELWHGFPLKSMAKMDKQDGNSIQAIHNYWSNVDMIMSYSTLYTTAMSACNGASIHQYQITGLPRNDALLTTQGRPNLQKVIPEWTDHGEKIIFFMPTFRKSVITPDKKEGGKNFSNLFGLPRFNKQHFLQFLRQQNITLFVKLHPFEESFFSEELQELKSERIFTVNDKLLESSGTDLYDVLGAADMLITDYSSVYIDYLLLSRPLLFMPTDLEEYKSNRGLLLEPYDFWTPGPKINSQQELQDNIERFLREPEWYEGERQTILQLCHKYQDSSSSARVWKTIDEYIQVHAASIYQRRDHSLQHRQMQEQVKTKIQNIIELGDIAKANEAIQEYLKSNDPDPDIFSMNGMLHLLNNDPHEAINTFKIGHRHYPWDEDLLYNLGYVYEMIGNASAAVSHYKEALKQTERSEMTSLLRERLALLAAD